MIILRLIVQLLPIAVFACTPFLRAADSRSEMRSKAEKACEESIEELRIKALAQSNLGVVYEDGLGVPKDDIEAEKWKVSAVTLYRKAAEKGDASSMYDLARAYLYGRGVPKDLTETVNWYRKAAESGHLKAQIALGDLFFKKREGVVQDKIAAAKWYSKAAEQYLVAAQEGNVEAQYQCGSLYKKIADTQFRTIEEARYSLEYRNANFWFLKASYQGHSLAQLTLSTQYLMGFGVAQDEIESVAWQIISADGAQEFNKEDALDGLKDAELHFGAAKMRLARLRSKEILAEIEATKAKKPAPALSSSNAPKASGTGAIVTASGHVLTAAHVVAGATSIKVMTAQGMNSATVLRVDEANDIAVLKISDGTFKPLAVAPSRVAKLGQAVATIGFPNPDFQGFSPKVTKGEISSVNGFADDPRSWQISVPVQPGNSGGPLLDENGNLIGVVESKLGLKVAQATGDIPQNVNYAVKSAYALALLEPYLDSSAPAPMTATAKPKFEDMVQSARDSVVLILSY